MHRDRPIGPGAATEDLFRPRGGVSAAITEAQEEQVRRQRERKLAEKRKKKKKGLFE